MRLKGSHNNTGIKRKGLMLTVGVAIATLLVIIAMPPLTAQPSSPPSLNLPGAAAHPLPPALEAWVDVNSSGDYFEQISPAGFGYLVWSDFPIHIVLDETLFQDIESDGQNHNSAYEQSPVPLLEQQRNDWHQAIVKAVEDWNQFIPIEIIDASISGDSRTGDIIIAAQSPPLRWSLPEENDSNVESIDDLRPRAQTAETTYTIYLEKVSNHMVMKQRYTIMLSPKQSLDYLTSTARHEIGHALGLWGHSPEPEDALYFAQVHTPPSISNRDINTLQKIYQQPTQLGWPLIETPL
ncbi:MAG: matrixin family metalloprotease [Cyanobacteria bacterium P01_F01_bin.150]